ncbi:MAG: hypothetical protein KAW12_13915 [Candidatus Aminicenantes bacterium]|nr:hypothetical protein [Candidatus Aminicenantes bacterium]
MKKSIFLLALFCLIIVTTSCSQPGEATVKKYFVAMKMDDKDTMGSMAIEPKDLEYKEYEIVTLSEPEEKELELAGLEEKLKALIKERTEQGNNAQDAQDNLDDLDDELEETRRASKKAQLRKQIEAADAAFEEEKQKYRDLVQKIVASQKAVEREKSLIGMSTGRKQDLDMFTGKTYYQKVDVKVTLANDEVKDYVFCLRKSELMLGEGKKTIGGRLIIIQIDSADDYKKSVEKKEAEAAEQQPTEEVTEEKPAEEKPAEEKPAEEKKDQ